jgi:hypothetical protein
VLFNQYKPIECDNSSNISNKNKIQVFRVLGNAYFELYDNSQVYVFHLLCIVHLGLLRLSFDEFITFRKTKVNAYLVSFLRYLLYRIIPFNSPWSCSQNVLFCKSSIWNKVFHIYFYFLGVHRPNFDRWIQFDNSQKNLISFFSFLSNCNVKAKAKHTCCSNMLITWNLSKLVL